jgi:hypothetical protein
MAAFAESGGKPEEQKDLVDPMNVNANAFPPGSELPAEWSAMDRRVLINEIVKEMRKDSLKEEAAKKLANLSWAQILSTIFTQPAILLVLGFALTGIVGTFITGRWQRAEWDRQQTRLVEIQGIDIKYQIIDDVTKVIGERNAAALAIVAPLLGDNKDPDLIMKEEEEPTRNWQKVSHDWRANSQIIRLKIAVHIQNEKAPELFDKLIKTEKELGGKVTYLQKNFMQYIERDEESEKYLDDILFDIQTIGRDLKELVTIIANEAKNDIKSSRSGTS